MISATQASAGYINDKMTDRPIERQPNSDGESVPRTDDVVRRQCQTQGRPARGTNEAGPQKIVDGLRLALRERQNIHVTRKEIAQYARVTPALVTYYYPEKDNLIEAATFPIVDAMVDAVEKCLTGARSPQVNLLEAIDLLIASYARDAAIIDLFSAYRASKPDTLPDVLGRMDVAFKMFFDHWLKESKNSVYDAAYLQQAAIGMCKIVAPCRNPETLHDPRCEAQRTTQAEAICSILLNPMSRAETVKPSALEG